jgi:hypothetical protein
MKIPSLLIWLSLGLLGGLITCVAWALMVPSFLLGKVGEWVIELSGRFE